MNWGPPRQKKNPVRSPSNSSEGSWPMLLAVCLRKRLGRNGIKSRECRCDPCPGVGFQMARATPFRASFLADKSGSDFA